MTLNSTRSALASALEDYIQLVENNKFLSAESFAEEIAAAAESEDPSYVVFYFDLDDLRDEIYMLTHYKAKNVKSQEKDSPPVPRLDELTITQDEEELLDKLLKNAAKDIYKIVAPYGRDISGGYVFNLEGTLPGEYDDEVEYNEGDLFYVDDQLYYTIADETPADTDPEDTDYFTPVGEWYNTYHKIIFTLNYNSNMDASMIDILNDDLEDAILKHCILEWYKAIREMEMIPLSQQEYDDANMKAHRSLWAEKTPTRLRTNIL